MTTNRQALRSRCGRLFAEIVFCESLNVRPTDQVPILIKTLVDRDGPWARSYAVRSSPNPSHIVHDEWRITKVPPIPTSRLTDKNVDVTQVDTPSHHEHTPAIQSFSFGRVSSFESS